mmetsp:Transcript_33815/g.85622  ORF Transcript_33815/g.85622 Transcript_33815/m.85622 type:complete len:80 (+) Transcript_33815:2-241(+)
MVDQGRQVTMEEAKQAAGALEAAEKLIASTYQPATLLGLTVTPALQKTIITACIMALVSLLPVGPASIVQSAAGALTSP